MNYVIDVSNKLLFHEVTNFAKMLLLPFVLSFTVCQSVCLSVCLSSELLRKLLTNFDETVWTGVIYVTNNSWLDFLGDPEHDAKPGIFNNQQCRTTGRIHD